ncbi:MAG: hypothetical protein ACP5GZ_10965 [Vulcanisaeta sp.]|uniref:hypothetical protein n=1 Tax=Vulcanisaeta sp. TaxID=2020871 RepID=UPI003D1152AA
MPIVLLVREFEVNELVSFDDAIRAVEDGFRLLGSGGAVNLPRRRAIVGGAVLHVLQGVVLGDSAYLLMPLTLIQHCDRVYDGNALGEDVG